jgi:hypothetical protein
MLVDILKHCAPTACRSPANSRSNPKNTHFMKAILLRHPVALALVASILLAPAARAASAKVEESFPLKPDGRVRVENVNGRIEVRAWDGEGVKLEAVKEGRSDEVVAGIKIITESTPDRLAVKTELAKIRRGWWRRISHEGAVNYVLHVPAGAELEKVSSVNGDLRIVDIRGPVRASTVNGSIRAEGLAGAVEVETVNGGIETGHVAFAKGRHLKASSVNGGIRVRLPVGTAASLAASTVNGSIHSDFPFTTVAKESRRRIDAQIGGGGGGIELSTVNGGIRIVGFRNEQASVR